MSNRPSIPESPVSTQHLLQEKPRPQRATTTPCPHCGDEYLDNRELRNYIIEEYEGDIYCTQCNTLIAPFVP